MDWPSGATHENLFLFIRAWSRARMDKDCPSEILFPHCTIGSRANQRLQSALCWIFQSRAEWARHLTQQSRASSIWDDKAKIDPRNDKIGWARRRTNGPNECDWRNDAFQLMNALTPDQVELELTPDVAKAVDALVAELDSAAILEALQARASTLTPVMEKILQFRPSFHWGINE